MDRRLLSYYNRELRHLQEVGAEFASEFPKIAGRLGLDQLECTDPYVERLLEGFAFLAARVSLKLDAEFPRFTQGLLETVYPHYLNPIPSAAIVRFQPDLTEGALADGFEVPRGTALRSIIGKGEQTPCEYRTAHDLTLWPLELAEASCYTRELGSLDLPHVEGARGGIRIRVRTTAGLNFSDLKLQSLTLHLRGSGDAPVQLYEQFLGRAVAVVVQPTVKPIKWHEVLPASSVRRVGFRDEEALLPHGPRSFQGYRLLQEYFTLPQRYMFVELTGLGPAVQRCEGNELDIVLLTGEPPLSLENLVDADSFALFCTPAVNLFEKRADRIHLSDRYSEFHVVLDRARPLDFEVYQVQEVTGLGAGAGEAQEFRSFYAARDVQMGRRGREAYFAVNRVPRALSSQEKRVGPRSSYTGSEVYVSLVDAQAAPYRSDLKQLAVSTLCTNRDLPLRMPVGTGRTDFTPEVNIPVESLRCVGSPTPPRPSHIEGETAWRLVSHLALNYISIADTDRHQAGEALRDLLKLYGDYGVPQIRNQIDGVRAVRSRPITRRVATPGPIAFARGLEITVTLDETAFEGTGAFLLGAVFEEFFARYVSINSFTETVVETPGRGEIMRWPARVGRRQIL